MAQLMKLRNALSIYLTIHIYLLAVIATVAAMAVTLVIHANTELSTIGQIMALITIVLIVLGIRTHSFKKRLDVLKQVIPELESEQFEENRMAIQSDIEAFKKDPTNETLHTSIAQQLNTGKEHTAYLLAKTRNHATDKNLTYEQRVKLTVYQEEAEHYSQLDNQFSTIKEESHEETT